MSYLEFQITLAIRLSLQVYQEPSYLVWAHKWLDGSDRNYDTASAAYTDTAYAAYAYAASASADASASAYSASASASYAADAADVDDAYAADVYASYAADAAAKSIEQSIKLGAKLEAIIKFI